MEGDPGPQPTNTQDIPSLEVRLFCISNQALQAWLARNCDSVGKRRSGKKLSHKKCSQKIGHFIPNTAASICPRTLYEEIMVNCGDADASVQPS